MEISIKLEIADWQKFQSHIEKELRKSTKSWTDNFFVGVALWAAITLIFLTFFQNLADSFHWPTACLAAVVFFLILAKLIFDGSKLKKAFAPSENGVFIGEHQFSFNDDGFAVTGKGYETRCDWSTVRNVERVNGMIFMYLDTAYAYLFPESQLEDPDEFYRYICTRNNDSKAG